MQVHVNRQEYDSDYLEALNTCFPGWGGQQFFQWVFGRALENAPSPDRIVLTDGGHVIAGSGVSYRRLGLPTGEELIAGIMTGSWTLPPARGRGCFATMIQESRRLTAERGGTLLLAFVTEENPSCRQLLKAGAIAVPSVYAIRQPSTSSVQSRLRPITLTMEHFRHWSGRRRGLLHFVYTWEDFQSQFVNVPGGTITLGDDDGGFAVIRPKSDTNQILAFSSPASPAKLLEGVVQHSAGKKVYVFTMVPSDQQGLSDLGFQLNRGFLTMDLACRSVSPQTTATFSESASWALQTGDKM